MIALSIIGPIARVRPAKVMALIVCPAQLRKMQAESTEIGNVMTAIAVIRHWPRNSKIVNEQRIAPSTPSCTRLVIACRTKTD